ncbi:esterase/lipase family protein [Nocardia sp. NBC_01009]|uniref:esterase/lipase family protein n=1 Tax=Nocardia sp. NBC_01009 TaxID=2975996 RepID=UPI0038671249|nr:alpha/beta fold hydrolase [Nocardia sp. NBC_01009]
MTSTAGHASRLIVYVPGLTEKPGSVNDLFARLQSEPGYGLDETIYWQFPDPVRRFTRGSMAGRCRDLADRIDAYWTGPRRAPEIVLIGHSMGGVMLRYAYLQALCGLDGSSLRWAQAVTRIVLLAAPNRGLDINRQPWWRRWPLKLFAPLLRMFTAIELITGSPFITNLRIQWIREVAALAGKAPMVVQVRGRNDAAVRSEDSRDLEALPTGVQRALPLATHADIIATDNVREDYPGQRYDMLRWAITESVEPTSPSSVPADEAAKTSIVFALHGIRSGNGEWPADLETQLATGDNDMMVVTPSYGRVSAYDFALPLTRRRNLRWFADQYSFYLARHPGKPFHFVGHSNGTYLFGQSLKQIPALRFQHVLLAGSVLPRDFDWVRCADRGQVRSFVNVCASQDKPVGWLCSALRGLGMRDVGVGGFTGFDAVPPGARQVRYIKGGHGAALVAARLSGVAGFVRTGQIPGEIELVTPTQSFGLMSRFAPTLTWVLAAALLGLGWLAVSMVGLLAGAAIVAGLLIAVYAALKVA